MKLDAELTSPSATTGRKIFAWVPSAKATQSTKFMPAFSGRKFTRLARNAPPAVPKKNSLLINIQAKLDAGKGVGNVHWATVFNLKQMAKTALYLQEHDMGDVSDLSAMVDAASVRVNSLPHKSRRRAISKISRRA